MLFISAMSLFWAIGVAAQSAIPSEDVERRSFADVVATLELRPGLFDLYLDHDRGRVLITLPPASQDGEIARFLYVESLVRGLGSNPVGLDRGQLGSSRFAIVRRIGAKVLIEEPNLKFRAETEDLDERRAAEESFASSVLWAGEILARDEQGRLLVDFTTFLVRDAHRISAALERSGQGDFHLDLERSAADTAGSLAFPDNLELEAWLTFTGEKPGELVEQTVPDPSSVTLVLRHSLIRLPEEGYEPRLADVRAGCIAISFRDFAMPLTARLDRGLAVRHRLARTDRESPRSPVVKPIVYYVDRGIPEPIRGALIEGASWWKEAFEATGAIQAFHVEILPEGVHPLDVRYNVVQWVHRSTRGWSYGGGIVDPRTGERIKGQVLLDSQRIRQDQLLFEGLAGALHLGSGSSDDPMEISLARIRQLAAHEVGHSLGLEHNFAASSCDRASVMDYPAPYIQIDQNGDLDFSQAYAQGIGAWDIAAIRWLYSEFGSSANETEELEAILREAREAGLLFLSDADARSPGSCHPKASLWDNGADPVAALESALAVRSIALERFGANNLALGAQLGDLELVFAPVYLHHRYQLEAAAKAIGGMEYSYAVVDDPDAGSRPVAPETQRKALILVLDTLDPKVLDIREDLLAMLLPPPGGAPSHQERFGSASAPAFDALGAAATAADLSVSLLLEPRRCARMVDFHRRDPEMPGLREMLDELIERAFAKASSPREQTIAHTVQGVVVDRMIALASDPTASLHVRAHVEESLLQMMQQLEQRTGEAQDDAHRNHLARAIARWLHREGQPFDEPRFAAEPPPGSPIGMEGLHGFRVPAATGCSLDF